jgi:integrase
VDARRDTTRVGRKKAKATHITHAQAVLLKTHPDTPQGRRDTLLMCLLLDHGLRESEVYDLQGGHLNLNKGTMTFYRRKVDTTQTHKLSGDTLRAAAAYLQHDAPASGHLLRGSRKGGALTSTMSISAIKRRVRVLGAVAGIDGLSPHDCRHYWATTAAEKGVNPLRLQEAGGWASLAMPRRYVEASAIANEGMV